MIMSMICSRNVYVTTNVECYLNFRIDSHFTIKVADFGLAVSTGSETDYFRISKESGERLPVKWMAPESITDLKFSEKSDIVRILYEPEEVLNDVYLLIICNFNTYTIVSQASASYGLSAYPPACLDYLAVIYTHNIIIPLTMHAV